MEKPGERINRAALEAMNIVLAERQAALDDLHADIAGLELDAAKAKVEVRFIHYCQERDPHLVPSGAEKLAELESALEGMGTSLSYRLEQEALALRQMEALRDFMTVFQRELAEEMSASPPPSKAEAA